MKIAALISILLFCSTDAVNGAGVVLSVEPQSQCVPDCGGGVPVDFNCSVNDGSFPLPQRWVITTDSQPIIIASNNPSVPFGYEILTQSGGVPTGLRVLNVSEKMNGYNFTCIGFDNAGIENASSPALLEVAGQPSISCINKSCSNGICVGSCSVSTVSCRPITKMEAKIGDSYKVSLVVTEENSLINIEYPREALNIVDVNLTVENSCGFELEVLSDSVDRLSATELLIFLVVVVSLLQL